MIYENEEDKSKYKIEFLGEKFTKDLKVYKVIIVGIYGVGKTSIIHKLMNKEVDEEYEATISVDIKNIQVKVNDKIIQIQIWDTCGNDKFAEKLPNLFKNVSIAIIVYAINDKEKSFKNLSNWYNLVKGYSIDSTIFLIGNKSDLKREVSKEDVEAFKNSYDDNIKIFFETSALNGENIDKLLEKIAISIYKKNLDDENKFDNAIKGGIILNREDFTKKAKKKKKKKFC